MKLFSTDESDIPEFPLLYRKTSTGAIQQWKVQVVIQYNGTQKIGESIYQYGQMDGKTQTTKDIIKKGKNIGKANETNVIEQTILTARQKWEKQKKKGYVESIEDAKVGKVDSSIIKGGINPMLAHKYRDHAHKIEFPACVQPKLDGHRCIAVVDDQGKCTLWSRTRKQITSMVHIQEAIEKLLEGRKNLVFDGELYSHEYKSRFEELSSAIRQEKQPENYEIVQYHIYDCINEDPFIARNGFLSSLIRDSKFIRLVETKTLSNETEVKGYFKDCIARGYEGAMIRNIQSSYEFKRSYGLQKIKEFDEDEFKIVGIEEGKGKLRGHVGSFICVTVQGNEFGAKMSGSTKMLKKYFEDYSLWEGQILTVQFQGLTNKERVPRFGTGLRFRKDI